MTKKPGLHMFRRERLPEERIVEQVDLPDRKIICRTPPRIELSELIRAERRSGDFQRLEAFGHGILLGDRRDGAPAPSAPNSIHDGGVRFHRASHCFA
jgi:hypothetical protein